MQQQVIKREIIVIAQVLEDATEVAARNDDGIRFIEPQEAPNSYQSENERRQRANR